jgi:hypothetical protein
MPPTLYRENGFSIRMYPNDHVPPHVHVARAEGLMRVALGDEESRPRVLTSVGMKTKDEVRGVRMVERHQSELLIAWEEMHHDHP